jgi:hypothetical protein
MAFNLFDAIRMLSEQGQGYGQGSGQDQGSGLLAMMQQQQQGVPNQLATDDVRAGTGILSGGYGTDRLLGAGGAPAAFGTGITGGGVDDNGLPAAAGAGAATANAVPLAPASTSGGGLFSGLSGAGASDLFSGLAGKAGGLSQWVQNNPGTIDALATGFANIGNKNVGNPFLYGANQAADELKEQVKGEAMKAAMLKLGYPAEVAAAGGKVPAMSTAVITNALKPKEGAGYKIESRFNTKTGQEEKVAVFSDGTIAPFGGQKQPSPMSTGDLLAAETGIRKEVHDLPSYKNYTSAESVYRSMVETADVNSAASDLNLVYGVSKIFDPGSVVREGEQVLVRNTNSLPGVVAGALNKVLTGGAALDPETRRSLIREANSRMREYRGSFDQDTQQYNYLAKQYGIDPNKIIPQFRPLPGVPAAAATPADAREELKRRGL